MNVYRGQWVRALDGPAGQVIDAFLGRRELHVVFRTADGRTEQRPISDLAIHGQRLDDVLFDIVLTEGLR